MTTTPEFNNYVQQVRDVLSGHLDGQPLWVMIKKLALVTLN
jgi:hypothetical protein